MRITSQDGRFGDESQTTEMPEMKPSHLAWQLVFLCPLATLLAPGFSAAAEDAGRHASLAENKEVTTRLRSSLSQVESLAGATILFVTVQADGTAQVVGPLAKESQRAQIETDGLKALQRERERGTLSRDITRVDASPMTILVTDPKYPIRYVLSLDKLLGGFPDCMIQTREYNPETGRLSLSGVVENSAHLEMLGELLPALDAVGSVDTSSVIVASLEGFSDRPVRGHQYAYAALRANRGQEVVDVATDMIRRGYRQADVWYLRAAGHLLTGRKNEALGDMRVAAALEAKRSRSPRFLVLEHFQGPLRLELERTAILGPIPCIAAR